MTQPAPPPLPEPQYKGGDLDASRGPGLGCFYIQLVLLAVFIVLTPISAFAGWNPVITVVLMVATIVLLLVTGQTIIFLLRIVAAERGRRRPLASRTRTVGEIEASPDERPAGASEESSGDAAASHGGDGSGVRE